MTAAPALCLAPGELASAASRQTPHKEQLGVCIFAACSGFEAWRRDKLTAGPQLLSPLNLQQDKWKTDKQTPQNQRKTHYQNESMHTPDEQNPHTRRANRSQGGARTPATARLEAGWFDLGGVGRAKRGEDGTLI